MKEQLKAQELTLFRGERCLFRSLSFALNSGQALHVQGPNGSGKTSLLRAVAGLIELESGDITWRGQDIRRERQAYHGELSWFAHRTGFKADLTVLENLAFESGLRAMAMERRDAVLDRLNLSQATTLPFRALSAGQQRRAALARLLLSAGRLWLMDEPFTNLDTDGQALVVTLIEEHLADGGLCLLASHQDVELRSGLDRIGLS